MVTTRGKKRIASSVESIGEEEGAENALTEMQTSDLPIAKMEEPEVDAKVEVPVEEARNDQCEVKSGKEDSGKNKMENIENGDEIASVTKTNGEENATVTKTNGDENATVTETNGDDVMESEENTSEDAEMDDQDVMWEDDYDSEDSEESFDVDEGSEDNEIEEQDDDDDDDDEDDDDDDEDEDEDGDGDEVGKEGIGEEDDKGIAVCQEGATSEKGDQDKIQYKKEIMKVDGGGNQEQKNNKTNFSLRSSEKASKRSTKEKARRQRKVSTRDKLESSSKRNANKRVQTMGMIFMCSSKTKDDCYKYKVLGLPESKKGLVEKIYSGMRLFLFDVDLKLLYGIYKAKGPGGYDIQPKAFKSQYPAQVRFTILKDCLPIAEEKFKKVIKDNYFTKTKFDCVLKSDQVRKLCELFMVSNRRPKPTKLNKSHEAGKMRRSHRAEDRHPVQKGKSPRWRVGDKRRVALRGDRERPRKRPREVIITTVPVSRPLPTPVSPRGPYLERRVSFKDRRISHRESYGYGRYPPTEYDDYYRDGRAYVGRVYSYRDGLDNVVRSDPYRDVRHPYSEYRDSYPVSRGQGLYLEARDSYRNQRDPYTRGRDVYRDGQDSVLYHRGLYRDVAYHEPYSSTYKHEGPQSDQHQVYRREDMPGCSELRLETRQDSYGAFESRGIYGEKIYKYSSDYPPRGIGRQYQI